MKTLRLILLIVLCAVAPPGSLFAQQNAQLGVNAALRYWSAFAEMQDSAISDQQAKELNAILDGTAPYDDLKYKDLVAANRSAVETMRSEEHTSELQSRLHLVCRLLLEKKNNKHARPPPPAP